LKASIIIPVFNSEKTLPACLKSLSQQSINPFEIIVVDDGSSDNSVKTAKAFNATVLKQEHAGPAKARNFGAKTAGGDVLVFIDADCVAEKNWLEEMIRPFHSPAVVGVQGAYLTKQKSLTARFVQIEIEERYERMKRIGKIDWVGSYSAAYRKKDFLEEKGFDESFPIASGEDPELSFKISKKGKRLVFNEKAIVYHSHPDNLPEYLKVKFFRAYWRMFVYRKHKTKAVRDSYTPQSLKIQIALVYALLVSITSAFFSSFGAVFSVVVFLLAVITMLPFTINALKKDFAVGITSPIMLWLRAIVFALGIAAGFAELLLGERAK
jgi:glycosyltransferase involved in cell wall biosynthesis